MILIDGVVASAVPVDDRGLTYGDGVFRTLVLRDGRPEFWPQHYARLTADCRALGITPPALAALTDDLNQLAIASAHGAVRIIVTRGSSARGYAIDPAQPSRRIVSIGALPRYPDRYRERGVCVRYCALRLAAQPRLAGVKHLNRLENVLARAEWTDTAIAEGLLLDADNLVIEGTRCNVFIVERGALVTPDLSHCGVAGVTRTLIMEAAFRHDVQCWVQPITQARLESANEVFLVNSLIGVWPVAAVGDRTWSMFTTASLVGKWLHALRSATH
jgi:4-amino-4-deoxychorismate lyase